MRIYQLTTSHLSLAHEKWRTHLKTGDCVIDATCGNGHDSLFLAQCIQPTGKLYAIDIQPQAILNTQKRLQGFSHCYFFCQSHAKFPPECKGCRLVVYNLGYLPKGDDPLTTQTETTLQSIQNALDLLTPDGMVSITCYPGHPEGAKEETALYELFQKETRYTIDYYKSARVLAPSFFIIHSSTCA